MLKLTATKLELEAKQAQGENVATKLAAELKKLNNNISLDKAAAGEPSTALKFSATISGGGAAKAKARAVDATQVDDDSDNDNQEEVDAVDDDEDAEDDDDEDDDDN